MIPMGTNAVQAFHEGTVAMLGGYNILMHNMSKINDLQWDLVTYPNNPKAPGVGSSPNSLVLNISAQSRYKSEAFQVMSVVLSDEVQKDISRNGRSSVLRNPDIQSQIGLDITDYQSKNVVALTKPKLSVIQPYKFAIEPNPAVIITRIFNSMLYEGIDINTALRQADEQMNRAIQEQRKE